MKKLVSVGVLFLVTVTLVSAIGISVGGKGGFGFGTGRMTDGLEVVVNSAGDPTTASPLFYSAAQGIPILVGAEIVPLENLTVELTGGYLFGLEQDVWNYDIQATNVTDVMTAKTSFIPVALTVKGKVPVGQRLTFYGGGGPSFGFGAKSLAVRDYDDGAGTTRNTGNTRRRIV